MTDDAERREQAIKKLMRYRTDFEFYARDNLKIRNKDKKIVPFILNKAQKYVLAQLTEQIEKTGFARAIILKGRQQGISTLIGAWYYWQSSMGKNEVVYILAHEQPASDSLFSMVDRYHKNNPIAPHVGTSNAKELKFDLLSSEYVVSTAGAKAGGRSRTASLFHGSEVAFWPNASDHFASSVQTVPLAPGTAILLESTANGAGGEFFERWTDAVRGTDKDDNPVHYIPIFVPWFWQPEYAIEVDETFVLRTEKDDSGITEEDYAKYFGVSDEHMSWRRFKIGELRSQSKFRQEYPAEPEEAFTSSASNPVIASNLVTRARKNGKDIEGHGALIIGCDPAGAGGDRFAIAWRRGAKVEKIDWRDKIDEVAAANWIRDIIDEYDPEVVNIDAGGIGHAVISMVRSFGEKYEDVVRAINFGSTSQQKSAQPQNAGPKNRRAEMWIRMKEWLSLEEGVSLPDEQALQGDMTGVQYKASLTNDIVLESKDEMRKRGVRSPDLGDAIALTFASIQHIEIKEKPKSGPKLFIDDTVPATGLSNNHGTSHNGWMG